MTQENFGRWAATVNMELAHKTLLTAIKSGPGCPRLAVFYGPSGYGKTVAAAAAAARTDAAYLRVESLWTQKTLLEEFARELGVLKIANTAINIFRQIKLQLQTEPRPIIIDEMDNLVNRRAVEVIRDIHEATDIAILMIGEEQMPARLKEWDRFDNRIVAMEAAEPATLADGLLLRNIYADKVAIADDLIAYFVESCAGVTRRIVINIHRTERFAIEQLATVEIDRAAWGNTPVLTNALPRRRELLR